MKQAIFDDAVAFYSEHYEVIARYPFIAKQKIRLQDQADDAARHCRFCRQAKPVVSFANDAHAVPEFLGNRDILSLNECDQCNTYLATNYEDHLSKWSLFARAASQVKGKKAKPTFKNPDETLRVGSGLDGLEITITDPALTGRLMAEGGSYAFTLPTDASSQPHVPIRAAMALVKIACSVCPLESLSECQPAIDWLMGRTKVKMAGFPVLYAFTPGPITDAASEVVLLRRKVEQPIPYLWCVVQFSNYRLQAFVPFCLSDATWLRMGENLTLSCKHYPTRFGPEWPYGMAELGWADWSGTEAVQRSATATFHVERAIRIDRNNQGESQ